MEILISPVALAAPSWVVDLIKGGSVYMLAQQLWNFIMNVVVTLLGMDLSSFTDNGAGAWEYIMDTVFPYF